MNTGSTIITREEISQAMKREVSAVKALQYRSTNLSLQARLTADNTEALLKQYLPHYVFTYAIPQSKDSQSQGMPPNILE